MRFIVILSILLIQACSTPSHVRLYQGPPLNDTSEVQLDLPLNFEILYLDNESVSTFEQTFRNHTLNIKLTPGEHTLVLRYNDLWQLDSENHDTLTTGQITFTGTFQAAEHFKIQTPPLNTYNQAKAFIDQPSVQLVSSEQVLEGSHVEKTDPLRFNSDEPITTVSYPNLRQLKFWWQQANAYEKEQFEQWITSNHP